MNLLIYPPFADPTQSYPALPLLKGYLKDLGDEMQIVDFNLEGLLETANVGGFDEIRRFQDPEYFYESRAYEQAGNALKKLYQTLSRKSGTIIDNNRHFDPAGPWTLEKLNKYFRDKKSPFHRFYQSRLSSLKTEKPSIVGINLTFTSQLPEAFYLAWLIKEMSPAVFVLLGGALAGQIVTQIPTSKIEQLLLVFDGICYFEGGPTLHSVISQVSTHNRLVEPVPNMLSLQDGRIVRGGVEIVDFKCAPLPDFDGFSLNKYLAPSPIVLFHPTAGCYWNRCSFCRYGFNQECGMKYREMNPKRAVSQIQRLKEELGVQNFYMSSDVLSPKFAIHFAEALIEKKIEIKWSTDLRIEESYTKGTAELLAKSGLVSVAFGIESGSDRVLQKMDKGINRELAAAVNRNFSDAGIATCWMMFHYHPTETVDEAKLSIQFLEQHRKHVSLFIVGEFGLTPHSKIFDNPKAFGIRDIFYHPDDAFGLYPYPEYASRKKGNASAHSELLDRMTAAAASKYRLRPYPFAGAISTHHSMLYFIRFGKDAFKKKTD